MPGEAQILRKDEQDQHGVFARLNSGACRGMTQAVQPGSKVRLMARPIVDPLVVAQRVEQIGADFVGSRDALQAMLERHIVSLEIKPPAERRVSEARRLRFRREIVNASAHFINQPERPLNILQGNQSVHPGECATGEWASTGGSCDRPRPRTE